MAGGGGAGWKNKSTDSKNYLDFFPSIFHVLVKNRFSVHGELSLVFFYTLSLSVFNVFYMSVCLLYISISFLHICPHMSSSLSLFLSSYRGLLLSVIRSFQWVLHVF